MKKKGKLFIIDDDELIVMMLSRALKADGYEVWADTGSRDVVDIITSRAPDIIILDINMPGQNGIDVLQEVKTKLSAEVVMLTADETAETAVRAMKLGAADYITKPFSVDEVKIVIGNTMDKIRLRHEVDYLRRVNSELFDKEMIGETEPIKNLMKKIGKMAEAHVASILITGESGTGKEVLA